MANTASHEAEYYHHHHCILVVGIAW
jgi:hypothetical protein